MEEIKQLIVVQQDNNIVHAENVVTVPLSFYGDDEIMVVAPKKMLRDFLVALSGYMADAGNYNRGLGYKFSADRLFSFVSDLHDLVVEFEDE